ncbi:CLUMA_CG005999, isoform B, partial [Clunio marinus]
MLISNEEVRHLVNKAEVNIENPFLIKNVKKYPFYVSQIDTHFKYQLKTLCFLGSSVQLTHFSVITKMDEDFGCQNVELHIYDMTQGMAAMMSPILLGRRIDGVWHTAVVVFGREYFFGSQGITSCSPGTTVLGNPTKIEKIGDTFIPYQVFKDYLRGLAESTFRGSCYSLLKHNCNTFSEDLCQFLCGASIPKYILGLPQEFLSTPIGQSLGPLIDSLGQRAEGNSNFSFEPQIINTPREPSPDYIEINSQIERIRQHSSALEERRKQSLDKIAKKERKKDKKRKKEKKTNRVTFSDSSEYNSTGMSEIEESNGTAEEQEQVIHSEMLPSEKVLEEEAEERRAEEERKKNREPPIVFKDIDPKYELEELVKIVDGNLSEEEQLALEELHQYLLLGDGCWALSDIFLVFVGRILNDEQVSTEARVHLLRSLAYAALKDDIILLLHQDRRDHVMMNYMLNIEKLKPEEQQALALFACNLFENTNSSEWLLYISEWTYNNQQTSNIRATTKVVVHSLLSNCPKLQEIGSALTHNLGIKEVFDDIAVEITMAILQFLNSKPSEEYLFRTLKALSKFVFTKATGDLISGVTLGLTLVPQSLAYANLANLPAEYGLYSAFMGSLVYVIFGTVREVSIGPTSLMSIITLSYTYEKPVEYVIIMTFICGCVEFLMGAFKLGFIVDFISAPVVSSFSTSTSLLVIGGQLKNLLGIKYSAKSFPMTIVKLFQNIEQLKFGDAALGTLAIIFLITLRNIKDIKLPDRPSSSVIKKLLFYLSISRNALILLVTSYFAYFLSLKYNHVPFILSEKVTQGIPSFELPKFSVEKNNRTVEFIEICGEIGSGLLLLPLVSVLANVAIAKAFTSGKIVDASQEMMALGLANIFGSFFKAIPTCGAFTRSAVSNASGVQTTFAGIYSATMTLLALTLLTPYFGYIPKTSLAAILICAVSSLIDFKIAIRFWKTNKIDFASWFGCIIVCVTVSIEIGLLFGVALSTLHVFLKSARPETSIYIDHINDQRVIFVRPSSGIDFPGVDYIREKINRALILTNFKFPITLDCEKVSYLDYTSIKALESLKEDLEKQNQSISFTKMEVDLGKYIMEKSSMELDENNNFDDFSSKSLMKSRYIKEYFDNTNIFVTGATGFLGKVLIEKLLRSCDGIERIYILLRPKRGLESKQRFEEFLKNNIFEKIREKTPEVFKKLVCIPGDINDNDVGLNEADFKTLQSKIDIVFHVAATVRFNEPLKGAANLNTFGTQRVMQLCTKMKNLKSLVHVSTAYSNPYLRNVSERVYGTTSTEDHKMFINGVGILPDEFIEKIGDRFQKQHPNTYTLTKQMAEQIVLEYYEKLPISIVRPSIVTASINEPFPGWIDNVYGITGILMEIGRGTISSIRGIDHYTVDLIPVDVVCNTLITAAWANSFIKTNTIPVYNCTSGQINPLKWSELADKIMKYSRKNPTKHVKLYPSYSYRTNRFTHALYEIFLHFLPAIIFDLVLRMQGKKPFMMKIAKRFKLAADTGTYFAMHEWNFDNQNLQRIIRAARETQIDHQEFNCDM